MGPVPANTIRQSADAPSLLTYDTAFVAVQGQGNTFVLFYENPWAGDGSPGEWFMKIDVPSDAEFVNADGVPYVRLKPMDPEQDNGREVVGLLTNMERVR